MITVAGLTKQFGPITAVNDVALNLGTMADYFNDISVADCVPRAGAPKAKEIVAHTLHFTDDSSTTLRFLEKNEEEDLPPFLDIVFGEKEPTDEKLRYAKDICARHVFSLSCIDTSKYQKACEEFFLQVVQKGLVTRHMKLCAGHGMPCPRLNAAEIPL